MRINQMKDKLNFKILPQKIDETLGFKMADGADGAKIKVRPSKFI